MILNLRTINWKNFIQTIFESHGHFTRLNLSIDDYKGVLDLAELEKKQIRVLHNMFPQL